MLFEWLGLKKKSQKMLATTTIAMPNQPKQEDKVSLARRYMHEVCKKVLHSAITDTPNLLEHVVSYSNGQAMGPQTIKKVQLSVESQLPHELEHALEQLLFLLKKQPDKTQQAEILANALFSRIIRVLSQDLIREEREVLASNNTQAKMIVIDLQDLMARLQGKTLSQAPAPVQNFFLVISKGLLFHQVDLFNASIRLQKHAYIHNKKD